MTRLHADLKQSLVLLLVAVTAGVAGCNEDDAAGNGDASIAGPSASRGAGSPTSWKPSPIAPASGPEKRARRAGIAQSFGRIERELASHGGSWAAWADRLEPFRQGMRKRPRPSDWRFTGNELRFLLVNEATPAVKGQGPLDAIFSLDRQLAERGIDLIVMPIPDKAAIYPDKISRTVPEDRLVALAMKRLMRDLLQGGVEVIDLYTVFRDHRDRIRDRYRLYHPYDTHWRNVSSQIAADEIAKRLKRYDFVREAMAEPARYETRQEPNPGRADLGSAEQRERAENDPDLDDPVLAVYDKVTGERYVDANDSPIVITGDSFARIYRDKAAHFGAQTAAQINMPVALLHAMGSGPFVPRLLAEKGPQYIQGKRVFIWTTVARAFYRAQWTVTDLEEAYADPNSIER